MVRLIYTAKWQMVHGPDLAHSGHIENLTARHGHDSQEIFANSPMLMRRHYTITYSLIGVSGIRAESTYDDCKNVYRSQIVDCLLSACGGWLGAERTSVSSPIRVLLFGIFPLL